MSETFRKKERLCNETAIEQMFKKGRKFHAYPFVAVCLKTNMEQPARILLSVAKKRFHTAVERNLIKRRVRTAYRTSGKFPAGYDVALIYIGNGNETMEQIGKAIETFKTQLFTNNLQTISVHS